MTDGTEPRLDERSLLRQTYNRLRWLLVVLPVALFIITTGNAIMEGRLETSISAYYGGPVRDVFVGVLVAIAACLIAYQGSPALEDYNLNGAAFYALFVALVPSSIGDILAELRSGADLSPEGTTIDDYVGSLRISLTLVTLLCVGLIAREVFARDLLGRLFNGGRWSRIFIVVTGATLVGFLALAMWQVWVPAADEVTMNGIALPFGERRLTIHDIAAVFLIVALTVAVWSHAWPHIAARPTDDALHPTQLTDLRPYQIIFGLMAAGPLIAGAAAWLFAPGHWIILLEWWEIGLFALFWVTETRRQQSAFI